MVSHHIMPPLGLTHLVVNQPMEFILDASMFSQMMILRKWKSSKLTLMLTKRSGISSQPLMLPPKDAKPHLSFQLQLLQQQQIQMLTIDKKCLLMLSHAWLHLLLAILELEFNIYLSSQLLEPSAHEIRVYRIRNRKIKYSK